LRALEVLGGLRSRKEKIITTPPFFRQKKNFLIEQIAANLGSRGFKKDYAKKD